MHSPGLVTDPVCGMRITPAKVAATREHRGTTYHFCSRGCAQSFDNDADAYIAAARMREAEGDDSAAFGWDESNQ
jgi:YHS domain-containing protein